MKAGILTGLSNSACIGVLQLLCTVTALRKLGTMAELGKMPKEVLVYSGPTYCNNNSNSELCTEREEKRLAVDSALEKRALGNYCLN